MNKKLQDAMSLQERLGFLIKRERQLLNEVLDAIIEADLNRSYLELGFSSLHAWLTKHFYIQSQPRGGESTRRK